MLRSSAEALLKSLKTMLATCLFEHGRRGIDFNRRAWVKLCELIESPAIEEAFRMLDKREDVTLVTELGELIADVGRATQAEQDMSTEEFKKLLREVCPLYAEADIQNEADDVNIAKRISNAEAANSARAKPPARPTVRKKFRPEGTRQKFLDAIADWADIDKIRTSTGFSLSQLAGFLRALQDRIHYRTTGEGRVEYKLKK